MCYIAGVLFLIISFTFWDYNNLIYLFHLLLPNLPYTTPCFLSNLWLFILLYYDYYYDYYYYYFENRIFSHTINLDQSLLSLHPFQLHTSCSFPQIHSLSISSLEKRRPPKGKIRQIRSNKSGLKLSFQSWTSHPSMRKRIISRQKGAKHTCSHCYE